MDQTIGGPMSNFFAMGYNVDELAQLAQMNHDMLGAPFGPGLQDTHMAGAHDYGDLAGQMQSSMQQALGQAQQQQQAVVLGGRGQPRRNSSMLGFGAAPPSDLDGFQFDPSPSQPSMPAGTGQIPVSARGIARRRLEKAKESQRRASAGSLSLDTHFGDYGSGYDSMAASPLYQTAMSAGVMPGLKSGSFNMLHGANGGLGIEQDFGGMSEAGNVGADLGSMNMFESHGMGAPMAMSMAQRMADIHRLNDSQQTTQQQVQRQRPQPQFHPSRANSGNDPGGGLTAGQMGSDEERVLLDKMDISDMQEVFGAEQTLQSMTSIGPMAPALISHNGFEGNGPQHGLNGFQTLAQDQQQQQQVQGQAIPLNSPFIDYKAGAVMGAFTTAPTTGSVAAGQSSVPAYPNAYSSSGFDMLGVLMRVAARPKPRIDIGAVDLSCAFVVCDATQHDTPIVYCSEMFERLTGYIRHEILGRNCRFLQAPDGRVQSGVKRKYVDDGTILYLKNTIHMWQEAQVSLINYRKGGQPFMNLLTMIPIAWDSDQLKYYVGFQVDLVEQPTSITNKNRDGTYHVNYQRGQLTRYIFPSPKPARPRDMELGQTIERDEVATVLGAIGSGETELSRRIWDKILLENSDDVVHVLSLKGLFLYMSPAAAAVLEYEPHELVGTALSAVCHPSDIVPVTRELKDTGQGATLNVVFRIRRKRSGYTWFESHGSLHTEQGKGKKCIILVGRARPVYALARRDVVAGFADNELWTKMSTAGMFLYVTAHVKSLIDRLPEELVGTSAHALMRADSRADFARVLELARAGRTSTFTHDLQNRRGQTLHAESTVYPGDAREGEKPTFLVAQTRLVKMSQRHASLARQSSAAAASQSVIGGGGGGSGEPGSPAPASSGSAGPAKGASSSVKQTAPVLMGAGVPTAAGCHGLALGNQDEAVADADNVFEELKTTRSTSWQFELRQMEKRNRLLAEELQGLLSSRKKRKRRKGLGQLQKDCANCHTKSTPEWRRGPSGQRDLCNSCGLRWAKVNGRASAESSQCSGERERERGRASTESSPRAGAHVGNGIGGGNANGNANGNGSGDGVANNVNDGNKTPAQVANTKAGNAGTVAPGKPGKVRMVPDGLEMKTEMERKPEREYGLERERDRQMDGEMEVDPRSPREINHDSHREKTARMEGTGGIPETIGEEVEPIDLELKGDIT